MRIALTGHSGFVGSIILKILSQNHEVITFGRNACDQYFDLATNDGSLAINGSFDVVIHAAYSFDHATLLKSLEVNALGSLELYEKFSMSGIKKFIYISSQSAHLNSESNYGITKYFTEQLLTRKPDVIAARLGYVYDEIGNHNLKGSGLKIAGVCFFPIPYFKNQRYFPTSVNDISEGLDYLLFNTPKSNTISIMGDEADLVTTIEQADISRHKFFIYFPMRLTIPLLETLNLYIKSRSLNRRLDSLRSLKAIPSERAIKWQKLL